MIYPLSRRAAAIAATVLVLVVTGHIDLTAQTSGAAEVEDTVTTADVRRFLDPTVMIDRAEYRFQANYLSGDARLLTHRIRPWKTVGARAAAWVRLPWHSVSLPGGGGQSGIGDISPGFGFVLHENLASRLTTSALGFDLLIPTGDRASGTGLDRWIVQPSAALVFNPTDLFPVFVIGRYQHSVADGDEPENGRVRSLNLSLQTFHILPARFYLLFIPNVFVDVQRDATAFTLGLGLGRAINRRLAWQAAYVQHAFGSETVSRGFQIGLNYLFLRQ